jgi:hypothetical protein
MKVGLLATMMLGALIAYPTASFAVPDIDGDGIPDVLDKCVIDSRNATLSCDTDQDGYGNVCDGDFNQNGMVTGSLDFEMIFLADWNAGVDSGRGTDMNCTSGVTSMDYTRFFVPQLAGGKPGPSGLACAGSIPCN